MAPPKGIHSMITAMGGVAVFQEEVHKKLANYLKGIAHEHVKDGFGVLETKLDKCDDGSLGIDTATVIKGGGPSIRLTRMRGGSRRDTAVVVG